MGRQKEVERHLSSNELDEAIEQAQQNDKARLVRRLVCIKNLYLGDTLSEAADRVGVDQATVSRWTDEWNEHGIEGLQPDFGGGRPSKLSDDEREQLQAVLEKHQPWTTTEIQLLVEEAFDVSYSKRHISRLLRSFGMNYAVPRPQSPDRPDDAEEQLEERLTEALADLEDDDLLADGGIVLGFLDEAWPRPTDNCRRLWAFGTPKIRKETPTANFDDAVFGYYALNGDSVVSCKPDVSKESVAEFFARIRENNSSRPIIVICDNFSSHFATLVDRVAQALDIYRVSLPRYSPDLNPIEPIWNDVRREISPKDATDNDEFRDLIQSAYDRCADRLSYAAAWADRFLKPKILQKICP